MPSLPKRIADLQVSDIAQLITDGALEDEQLEFKRDLPTKDGKPDRWYEKQEQIGDKARNELLEEVVGFANAYGGDLLIGIGETSDKPPRAASSHPVPACAELAHRLELAARDCIEPPLPRLEVRGVPIAADGAGYVVIRTAKSAIGPHRLTPTLHCYRRAASRSEKMTMRQIQDHTLAMTRSADQLEAKYAEQRQRFAAAMGSALARGVHGRLGMRVFAVPAQTDVAVDKVHGIAQVRPATSNWVLRGSNINEQLLTYVAQASPWRLVLRGTESLTVGPLDNDALVHLGCDGSIAYRMFMDWRPERPHGLVLYPGWLMAMVANAMASAERFRKYSGYLGVDYGLAVAISVMASAGKLAILRFGNVPDKAGAPPGVVFPRYAFGPDQSVLDAFRPFYIDFWANVGVDGDKDTLTELRPS